MIWTAETIVFVYGTLLRGEGNHGLLQQALYLGEARTEPLFELVDLGPFPAMVAEGTVSVKGELYGVDQTTLQSLDALEGHPRFYHRTPIRLDTGQVVQTYLHPRESLCGYPRIPSGDWKHDKMWNTTFGVA